MSVIQSCNGTFGIFFLLICAAHDSTFSNALLLTNNATFEHTVGTRRRRRGGFRPTHKAQQRTLSTQQCRSPPGGERFAPSTSTTTVRCRLLTPVSQMCLFYCVHHACTPLFWSRAHKHHAVAQRELLFTGGCNAPFVCFNRASLQDRHIRWTTSSLPMPTALARGRM